MKNGKKIGSKEIEVIVIKNSEREIKLAILELENGKSATILNAIKQVLNKYDLWKAIKMIFCDTTNVNTGTHNGVVASLQKEFNIRSLPTPQ